MSFTIFSPTHASTLFAFSCQMYTNLTLIELDALPLSHEDSMVSDIYYEVHMTRVLYTAGISNVDSVTFKNLTYI